MATRRRWLQFSLRTSFVVLTAFAAWLGMFVNAGHRQRQVRLHVERLGGKVVYDFERRHSPDIYTLRHLPAYQPPPPEPVIYKWLRQFVGSDFANRIVYVDLSGNPIVDADLPPLGALQSLEALNLNWTRITDDGLDNLKDSRSLRTLVLKDGQHSNTKVIELRKSLPQCRIIVEHFRKVE
jgi:Leucine Rich Repeat (LRR) protein